MSRDPTVLAFVNENITGDVASLGLRYSGKVAFQLPAVLEWLDALQRGKDKLPNWVDRRCVFTRRSMEQASSEMTAQQKIRELNGDRILNLCGGIGVDDAAFARCFKEVVSVEMDEEVHELALVNMKKLGIQNIRRVLNEAGQFLEDESETYDWIFADPDRRESGKRFVQMCDCSPEIIPLWSLIQNKSKRQLIKLSPLYPLEQLEQELPGIYRIEVVAWKGEVKEVLAYCETGYSGEVSRKAIELDPYQSFKGKPAANKSWAMPDKTYFYEVHPSLSKSGLASSYAESIGTEVLISNGIYQQSDQLIPSFFGREFIQIHRSAYSRKKFDQYLKDQSIQQANLASRFFKWSPQELKKLHRLKDGGRDYFFFFENSERKPYFIHGRKLDDIG
ncbi:MAG: hypothetical protein GC180_02965 [Bacteroidetes bacterium]|nr:hypothetical protein [Bacteroidota bacterium]